MAGISFEVREWAKILSDEIDRLVADIDKNQSKPQQDQSVQTETELVGFNDLNGVTYYEATVNGDELIDILDDDFIYELEDSYQLTLNDTLITVIVGNYGLDFEIDKAKGKL